MKTKAQGRQGRIELIELLILKSAEQGDPLTEEDAAWLVDSCRDGLLVGDELAQCVGKQAAPVFQQMCEMLA